MPRRPGFLGVLLALAALALLLPATASSVRLVRVAGGFDALTQVTAPRNGAPGGVLFVVEQEGQIWRRYRGTNRLFLDIRSLVGCCGERGLLSMAFSRSYGRYRTFYLAYTNNGGDIRVARLRANAAGTRAIAGSRRVILSVEHSGASNHNGGQLAFGPNGRLYVSTGDGGGGCDPNGNAQRLSSRAGKLLSISPANLRAGWRIDGYGLRNLWRFSFDWATGRLYAADVGQDDWEEINTRSARHLGGRPENYGWDVYEGRATSGCSTPGLRRAGPLVWPISVYGRSLGCSVTGGFVYRGRSLFWGLRGWYFFGDYCSGRIWRLKVGAGGGLARRPRLVRDTALDITSFGEGLGGELYVATGGGSVYRLARSPS
jgi:glucose/arabinose dehydrogenase